MKKVFVTLLSVVLMGTLMLSGCSSNSPASSTTSSATSSSDKYKASSSEVYYMVTFMSGLEYWKGCYSGFQDAAKIYNAKTIYTGAEKFDINQQVTVLNQVIAKKPTGIAITCVNADALVKPINNAIAQGIKVICFDSDSPKSNRMSIVATGNEKAGEKAADEMASLTSKTGEVGVIYVAGTPTLEERAAGYKNEIASAYKNMKVAASGNFNGDATDATKVASGMIQAHPNLAGIFCANSASATGAIAAVKTANKLGKIKIVGFDTDTNVLDSIKKGEISATIAQGAYNQGYWAMNLLFQNDHELMNPFTGWKSHNVNPMPASVDTGVYVVTKSNVSLFYSKK